MNVAAEAAAPAIQTQADLFVLVPKTTLPNGAVVEAFHVSQYFASEGADGKAEISATAKPWVNISYRNARKACADAGYGLLTELQALAIAHDIANVAANWISGVVGEGKLFQGLRKWTVEEAQAGDYVPADADEQRWFTLSNGSRIYDAAGNIFTWIFDDVQGDADGVVSKPFAENSPSITSAPAASMEKGVGWYPAAGRDWSGIALVRGGFWDYGDYAGVFCLDGAHPGLDDDYVGFRSTK